MALEVRYPFFDERLLEYAFALPVMPWGQYKMLLRLAMNNRLPRRVLRRPKTALSSNPMFALLSEDRIPRQSVARMEELRPYVDVEKFIRDTQPSMQPGWQVPITLHLLSVGNWLRQSG